MNEGIFRKKSLEKVKSPENLDDYIRVSNPGVWLLLLSVVFLLVGFCVWGIVGHIDSIIQLTVRVENGTAVCSIPEEDITFVKAGMTVKFDEWEAPITEIGGQDGTGFICRLDLNVSPAPEDGFYKGRIVIQSYKPLSFLTN